jgi:hypothetical protein
MAIVIETTQINAKFLGGLALNKIMLGVVEIFPNIASEWTIYSPFADGSDGGAFEIGVNGTMFQDSTGAVPVTTSGQPVGMFVARRTDDPLPLRVNLAAWTQEASRTQATQGLNNSTTEAVTAPDGSVGVIRMNENAANSARGLAWGSWAVKSGNTYTHSVYAKYDGRQWLQLNMSDGAAWAYATFDILNGVTGQQSGSVTNLAIEDVGDGWWRCKMTRTTGGGSGGLGLGLGTDGTINQAYQGASNIGALVWGQQVDAGPVALPYQRVQSPNGGWLPYGAMVLYALNAANRPLYIEENGAHRLRWNGVNNQFNCDTELPWLEFSLVNGMSFPEGQTASRTWWNNGVSPAGWQSWFRNTPNATNFINIAGGNSGPVFPTPLEFTSWLTVNTAVLRTQINDLAVFSRAAVGYVPRTGIGFNVGSGNGTTWYIGDWIAGGAFISKALTQSDIDNYKTWLRANGVPT